jgi:hypothetical protein
MTEHPRPFVAFLHEETLVFINLDRVTNAIVTSDECKLFYSEVHSITVHGAGALLLMKILADRASYLDGRPVASQSDFVHLCADIKHRRPN